MTSLAPLLVWLGCALVQDLGTIMEVAFEGEFSVPEVTLKSRLKTRVGQEFRWDLADQDRDDLMQRFGIQGDCRIESLPAGGVKVIWILSEREAVKVVEFHGNEALSKEELSQALKLTDRGAVPFGLKSQNQLYWQIGKLEELYEEEGYRYAEIAAELEEHESGNVLVFRILEGPKVRVDDIEFEGLTAFAPRHLRSVMATKESWLFLRRTFKRRVFDSDLAELEKFLRDEGYLDAAVSLQEIVPNSDYSKVDVIIRVHEGERYTIGEIRFEGNENVSSEELQALLKVEPGDYYRSVDLRRDLRKIVNYYGERGYIQMTIDQNNLASYRLDSPVVDMVVRINEDLPKRVRDVLVVGNVNTSDEVIRRELWLYPGDLFDMEELAYTQDRLRASRLFMGQDGLARVFVSHEPTADPRLEDVVIEVQEGDTGFMNFLAGFGSGSGAFVGINVDKENFDIADLPSGPVAMFGEFFDQRAFHGAGQRFQIRANPGARFSDYVLRFTEPALTGPVAQPLSLSLDLYLRETLLRLYDEDRVGGQVILGRNLTRDFSVGLGVRNDNVNIEDVDKLVPDVLVARGRNTVRSLIGTIGWTRLDSLRNPTDGFTTNVYAEMLGGVMGGDQDAFKVQLRGELLLPIYENEKEQRHVLQNRATVVWGNEFGDSSDVLFYERFRAGGLSGLRMRGFEFWGMGPHQNGEPVGGLGGVILNTDYIFPIYETFDAQLHEHVPVLKGVLWVDQGTLGSDMVDIPDELWRVAAGVGIRFRIPIQLLSAPLEVYYGVPFNRDRQDERESFAISISTRF